MASNNPAKSSDDLLLDVLLKEKHIIGFLKSVFGFLARKTDFYYVPQDSKEYPGFPPGAAEQLVVKILRQCNPYLSEDVQRRNRETNWNVVQTLAEEEYMPTTVAQEVEIESTEDAEDLEQDEEEIKPENQRPSCEKSNFQTMNVDSDARILKDNSGEAEKNEVLPGKSNEFVNDGMGENSAPNLNVYQKFSDSYNGAKREKYSWSQTIGDLDVTIDLPVGIKSKDVKVHYTSEELKVDLVIGGAWETVINDKFIYKTKQSETVWLVEKGQLRIHFEKQREAWWNSLLVNEPKIDTTKIDCSRPLHDLPEDHVAMIREMQWNQQQKAQGLPTSEQIKQQRILQKAWNQPGSPFANTPFDPTILNS